MSKAIRKGDRRPLTGPDDPRHGNNTTYLYWACRCDRCRLAHAEYAADLLARRRAAPTPDHVHGTTNGYYSWGCRCRSCTDAQRRDRQDRNARKARASVEFDPSLTPAASPDQTQSVSVCDLGFEHIVVR